MAMSYQLFFRITLYAVSFGKRLFLLPEIAASAYPGAFVRSPAFIILSAWNIIRTIFGACGNAPA